MVIFTDKSFLIENGKVIERQYSEGVEYVFVNGVLAYNKGAFTGSKSGMPLRKR